jgi:hypothetical protein
MICFWQFSFESIEKFAGDMTAPIYDFGWTDNLRDNDADLDACLDDEVLNYFLHQNYGYICYTLFVYFIIRLY